MKNIIKVYDKSESYDAIKWTKNNLPELIEFFKDDEIKFNEEVSFGVKGISYRFLDKAPNEPYHLILEDSEHDYWFVVSSNRKIQCVTEEELHSRFFQEIDTVLQIEFDSVSEMQSFRDMICNKEVMFVHNPCFDELSIFKFHKKRNKKPSSYVRAEHIKTVDIESE